MKREERNNLALRKRGRKNDRFMSYLLEAEKTFISIRSEGADSERQHVKRKVVIETSNGL
jgi:hypothetical protein